MLRHLIKHIPNSKTELKNPVFLTKLISIGILLIAQTVQAAEPTLSITANPSNINQGQASIISWKSTNSRSCAATGGWTTRKNTIGQQYISPLSDTTTYSITCSGPGGSVSKSVTITVQGSSGSSGSSSSITKPTLSITANPSNINQGQASIVSWKSTNSRSCVATGDWTTRKNTIGQEFIPPLSDTTTYSITCTGPGGSVSKSVTVAVKNSSSSTTKPTLNFSVSPKNINKGQSSTIIWSSSNANSCSATKGWTNNADTSGIKRITNITNNTTYSMTCIGDGGTVTKSLVVTVNSPTPTTGSVDLNWRAPATNQDGSKLIDLAVYKVYYGTSQSNLNKVLDIDAGLTSYVIENLPSGTHYFSISAIDLNGNESTRSNIAAKVVN